MVWASQEAWLQPQVMKLLGHCMPTAPNWSHLDITTSIYAVSSWKSLSTGIRTRLTSCHHPLDQMSSKQSITYGQALSAGSARLQYMCRCALKKTSNGQSMISRCSWRNAESSQSRAQVNVVPHSVTQEMLSGLTNTTKEHQLPNAVCSTESCVNTHMSHV